MHRFRSRPDLCAPSITMLWVFVVATASLPAQDFDGRPAFVLTNQAIELTVLKQGGTLANLALLDDADRLSPMWNTDRALKLSGAPPSSGRGVFGHFLCLDGFGTPSVEERAAGMPGHGEAYRLQFDVAESGKQADVTSLKLTAKLPLAQQVVTREMRLVDGENVAYVHTEVESLVAFDRPISWAEHATLGPPFLQPGQTVIEMPAKNCRVRPQKAGSTGKLAYEKDFVWPQAPLTKGGTINLVTVPVDGKSLDLASCQIDPSREFGYVTAIRADKQLIFGYVFRREEFPWLMSWMNYSGDARAARGIEFSTQPFDVSHRETVDAHRMFDTPTYKWLPAKAKLRSAYLMFYSKIPAGFQSVADVTLANGQLTIRSTSGQVVTLKARLQL